MLMSISKAEDTGHNPTALEAAYGMSFHMFDACDDAEAGQIFRQAILEKLKSCPYAPQTRQQFHDWLAENKDGLAVVQSSHLPPPPAILGMMADDPSVTTCKQYRETSAYQQHRNFLLRYSRGEVGVDQALGSGSCP